MKDFPIEEKCYNLNINSKMIIKKTKKNIIFKVFIFNKNNRKDVYLGNLSNIINNIDNINTYDMIKQIDSNSYCEVDLNNQHKLNKINDDIRQTDIFIENLKIEIFVKDLIIIERNDFNILLKKIEDKISSMFGRLLSIPYTSEIFFYNCIFLDMILPTRADRTIIKDSKGNIISSLEGSLYYISSLIVENSKIELMTDYLLIKEDNQEVTVIVIIDKDFESAVKIFRQYINMFNLEIETLLYNNIIIWVEGNVNEKMINNKLEIEVIGEDSEFNISNISIETSKKLKVGKYNNINPKYPIENLYEMKGELEYAPNIFTTINNNKGYKVINKNLKDLFQVY